jgi:hypothetical protein
LIRSRDLYKQLQLCMSYLASPFDKRATTNGLKCCITSSAIPANVYFNKALRCAVYHHTLHAAMIDSVDVYTPCAAPSPATDLVLDDSQTTSSVTHIFRLPYELLGEIFLIGRDNALGLKSYLQAITSVCSVWRSAALSHPSLWTKIRRPFLRKVECEVEYLETLLERSKTSSLDVALAVPYFPTRTPLPIEIARTIYLAVKVFI